MKRLLGLLLLFIAMPSPCRAYIDSSMTLGKVIAGSDQIVVIQVDKASREKQMIAFNTVAVLNVRRRRYGV